MKFIIVISILILNLFAQSPIPGYDREIQDNNVVYKQINGNFTFKTKQFIDMDNIYNKGQIDNYDDPYIQKILEKQTPLKVINGKSNKIIHIVFNGEKSKKNFLEEFGLDIFKEQNLTIKLYIMDKSKIKLPLKLSVYPFFIINDRFVQGVITKSLLKSLIYESEYKDSTLALDKFKTKIAKKYNMTDDVVDIKFNNKIQLFEVYEKGKKKVHSYVSSDGRYIITI